MTQPIPQYVLYEEPPSTDIVEARFLHSEPIFLRSRPRDWTIRAHSHPDLHQIHLIRSGGGQLMAETGAIHFGGQTALISPRGTIHAIGFFPETEGHVISFAAPMLDAVDSDGALALLFSGNRAIRLDDVEAAANAACAITREANSFAPGARRAAEAHLALLLVDILRGTDGLPHAGEARPGRNADLVARFRRQVERNLAEPRGAGWHARALGVSQSRLREACVSVTGRPPVRLITEARIAAAQRELIFGDRPVAAIGWDLGFDDPAYFSRVFTRMTRVSPGRFRSQQRKSPPAAQADGDIPSDHG